MAPNIWDNSTTDGLVNTAANWSLGNVPTGTDVMTFDEATSNTNCLFDVDIFCGGIEVGPSGYAGDIDMATFNLTTTDDMTFAGTGIFACGSGTLDCGGDFASFAQGTFSVEAADLVLSGTGTHRATGAQAMPTVVSGTYSASAAQTSFNTLTILSGGSLTAANQVINLRGNADVQVGGSLLSTGGGSVRSVVNAQTYIASGTWSAVTQFRQSTTVSGTFGESSFVQTNASLNRTVRFAANTAFTGAVIFNCDKGSRTFTIDLAFNDVSVEFQGDVTLQEVDGTATLEWLKAPTGTVTYNGTTTYTDSTDITKNIGNVEVSGDLTLASDMDCEKFDGLNGGSINMGGVNYILDAADDMDWAFGFALIEAGNALVGATLRTAGIFTADSQDISSKLGTWFLTVNGASAVANGLGDVADCDASGGIEIDASSGPWEDSGGNDNWDFGVVGILNPQLVNGGLVNLGLVNGGLVA